MVDAAHDKEQRARETIQSLKLEIANLSKLVEQGAGLTMGQDHRWVITLLKVNGKSQTGNLLLCHWVVLLMFCQCPGDIYKSVSPTSKSVYIQLSQDEGPIRDKFQPATRPWNSTACLGSWMSAAVVSTSSQGTVAMIHNSVNELLKIKDDLTKDRDEKLSDIAKVGWASFLAPLQTSC